MPAEQVLQMRIAATNHARSNPQTAKVGIIGMQIYGFDIGVPVFTVREGNIERIANEAEVTNIHNTIQQQRSVITEAWRSKGFRGIKIKIEGAPPPLVPQAPVNNLPLPPPPPPGMDVGLPPPPPPPSF